MQTDYFQHSLTSYLFSTVGLITDHFLPALLVVLFRVGLQLIRSLELHPAIVEGALEALGDLLGDPSRLGHLLLPEIPLRVLLLGLPFGFEFF